MVTGCYAQLKPEQVADIEGVDLVLGAEQKGELMNYLIFGKFAIIIIMYVTDLRLPMVE